MLIKDTPTLKAYAQVAGTPNIESFKATLRMVEETHIRPILGKDLLEELQTALDGGGLTDIDQQLLEKVRMVIGPLFCFYHADKADVHFTDAGMQRLESATNKTAYQEQRTKFKEANLAEGGKALEVLIQFLEENIQNYESWQNSDSFKQYRGLFIKTGTEFNELFPSASPYHNYWAMRAKMMDVEELHLRPFLGDALFDDLKAKALQLDPGFTEEEEKLLYKLKKAIANLTVAFAIPLLQVRIANNGLTVPAVASFSTNDNDNIRSGADNKAINTLEASCSATGADWLTNATNYLTANKTTFSTWIGFASSTTAGEISCNEDCSGGAFGMI